MRLATWSVNSLAGWVEATVAGLRRASVYVPNGRAMTEQERARLRAVEAAGGLIDAFRALHPDEPGFTCWDYRAGHFHRRMGLRIDLALLKRPLADRLVSCGIDHNFRKGPKPSDHAPLLVELGER
jgi:exodeoxyribonuclease III